MAVIAGVVNAMNFLVIVSVPRTVVEIVSAPYAKASLPSEPAKFLTVPGSVGVPSTLFLMGVVTISVKAGKAPVLRSEERRVGKEC